MIIKDNIPSRYDGCDRVVVLEGKAKSAPIKLLQITDMQFIDSSQLRAPDRLRIDEINAWKRENFNSQCADHIRALIAQSKPDLIFITGDIIYGQFDDNGASFKWFCSFMDSFKIPWAPVYGNHDNESKMGVKWQNSQFESSEYCLFKTGIVSGNGNYTVGIVVGDELQRVLYMTDSNGCADCDDAYVVKIPGIYPDQLEYFANCSERITKQTGRNVPAFIAFHIPTTEFIDGYKSKGYLNEPDDFFNIGVDVEQVGDDFGFKYERSLCVRVDGFLDFVKKNNVDGVFVGHEHSICTCVSYEGIKWVFGLKTGQYDFHVVGAVGGTLVTLKGEDFAVNHLPSLVKTGPYPGRSKNFNGYFSNPDELE